MRWLVERLEAAGYRITLAGEKIHLDFEGAGEPNGELAAQLIGHLHHHRTEVRDYLRQERLSALAEEWPASQRVPAQSIPEALRQAIHHAHDWHDLEVVLLQVQTAFEAGEVSQEQAEGLAAMAAQEAQVLPEAASGERLSALLRRQPVVEVYSKILGEQVLWMADDAQVPADNTLVVYREAELRQMAGRSPEKLRAIHATKKALDGEVIQA